MGSSSSARKPPVPRTSVRNYPGRQPGAATTEDDVSTLTYKTPLSGTPVNGEIPKMDVDGVVQVEPVPEPIVTSETLMLEKPADERDVILDDGDAVSGNPPKPEVTRIEANRQTSEVGREIQRLDSRINPPDTPLLERPVVDDGELWVDPDFMQTIAMEGISDGIQWLRPKDFLQAPCLYSDDTCRYDIEQGAAGTCWFLSVLQSLADKPEYLGQIIPKGSYQIGQDDYDGVFHCRFWKFGGWVDVYIDDFIPVMHRQPWGARSKTDPNELWVTLMEKAFAKLHGSYKGAWGGIASWAFGSLTGGTAEIIDLDAMRPKIFYQRIKNSLKCGSIVATSILGDSEIMGLVGNHSYAITGLCKVIYRRKYLPLVRIRNPWGNARGEWTGAWSDGSSQWRELSSEDKSTIEQSKDGDGEFWMSLTDYFQYFGNVTICNFTPDVDQDGKTDDMNNVWVVSGQWCGESAAGWRERMKNPKYQFEIPSKGVSKAGTPLAIQLMQKLEERKSTDDMLNIRADLFRIEAVGGDDKSPACLIQELTSMKSYWGGEVVIYRYPLLQPGKYLVVPHYSQNPGHEKEFLLRLFTQCKITTFQEVTETTGYYLTTLGSEFEHGGRVHKTPELDQQFGRWVANENAGGQMAHRSVNTNPQYQFRVTGVETQPPQPCSISISQDICRPRIPIGFRLFKRDVKNQPPMDTDWFYRNHQASPRDMEGRQGVFIQGDEGRGDYLLPAGNYVALVHSNAVNQEGGYFIQIATKQKANVKGYHICK